MIYFRNKSNQNRKILKWLKSKSKSLKNDLNRDLNHIRFKSPMILTTLLIRHQLLSTTPTSGPPGGLLKLIDTSDLY